MAKAKKNKLAFPVGVIAAVLAVIGLAIYFYGKKTESAKLAELKPLRDKKLDERIMQIHGAIPGRLED